MTIEEVIDTLNDIETDAIYSLLNIEIQAIDEAIEILEKVRDGRMIELPCKVGDTVYVIGEEEISVQVITSITIEISKLRFHSKCVFYGLCDMDDDPCMADEEICEMGFSQYDFGKTVFLTCEEAEKALKERG